MNGHTWECPKHHWDYRTCTCGTDSAESQLSATAGQRITPDPTGGNSPSRTFPEPPSEPLSRYDLRLRSLDLERGEGIYLCSTCDGIASWSVWLHTPDWPPNGGMTRVLCTTHAIEQVSFEAAIATRSNAPRTAP